MTEKQKFLYDAALATASMTDDPYVNWAVDNHFCDGFSRYNEDLEKAAIDAVRVRGGFLLSVVS